MSKPGRSAALRIKLTYNPEDTHATKSILQAKRIYLTLRSGQLVASLYSGHEDFIDSTSARDCNILSPLSLFEKGGRFSEFS